MKRLFCIILVLILLSLSIPVCAGNSTEYTILFTHDIHDYFYPTKTYEESGTIEHGGAARLATLVKENKDENALYLDAGDFSMGTLYQAAYSTDAYELRTLGNIGCDVTTFGNHEFDYGAKGTADMLRAALASGDPLPMFVSSNIDLESNLTDDQKELKDALDEYGAKENIIINKGDIKIGIFGLVGYDCIECIQTDLKYIDYIEEAKEQVKKLKEENCDIIIALSHAGTDGNGQGEDVDLAKKVDGIDFIISGHSHSTYLEPLKVNKTYILSCCEYLKYLGKVCFEFNDGKLRITSYSLLKIDSTVPEDEEIKNKFNEYKEKINNTYLKDESLSFDDVICRSNYNLMSLNEMYSSHQEYPMGNIIADSYLYEARQNGIDDIDVALVGLGTIRGSIKAGNITVADIFEICSLGVGGDGSAGHPLVSAYITGKELKLLTELDASLGTIVSSIKMSYSGLEYTFNTKRIVLDRVTDVHLVRQDGTNEEIEDKKLYKVAANMYAINMLGMLNGLTKGLLSITPKNEEGKPISDFYEYCLINKNGKEIKEWIALKNYLASFDKGTYGFPELPSYYNGSLGRKNRVDTISFFDKFKRGAATNIIPIVMSIVANFVLIIIIIILLTVRRKKKKRKANKEKESIN